MTQQSAIDLRGVERVRVSWQATILLDSRADPLPCAVLDISAHGARISLREAVRLPNTARVRLVRNDETFDADVAWQLGFDAGLRFLEPAGGVAPSSVSHAA